MCSLGSKNFYLVAAFEFVVNRDKFVVDFSSDGMATNKGVDGESKVERSAASRHGAEFTFGGEDKDFAGKEVELDAVEKVHGRGLRVVKDFLDGVEPLVQFNFSRGFRLFAIFIFPVSSQSFLCNFIHTA